MDRNLSVTTAAGSIDLTTIDRVKQSLGIGVADHDLVLARLVSAASLAAARYCRRVLVAETVSEQWRPYPFVDGASLANLPEFITLVRRPVRSIASVIEDEVTLQVGIDYEADPETGKLTRLCDDRAVRWRFRKLTVAYVGGYAGPDDVAQIAPDIEAAVIEMVKDLWFSANRDPLLKSRDQPGSLGHQEWWVGSTGQVGAWPQKFVDLLASHVAGGLVMSGFGAELIGRRRVALVFEQFPKQAHDRLRVVMDELCGELTAQIEAAVPSKTGKLKKQIQSGVDDKPEKLKAWVSFAGSPDFAKIQALEYGSHRRIKVRRGGSYVISRLSRGTALVRDSYYRTTNIAERRFLRDPLAAVSKTALPRLQAAVDQALAIP